MRVYLVLVALLGGTIAMSKNPAARRTSNVTSMARPMAGAPISFHQTEEESFRSADGKLHTETRESDVYRDRAGRLLVETILGPGAGEGTAVAYLSDPVAFSIIFLMRSQKVAYRHTADLPDGTPRGLGYSIPGLPMFGRNRQTEKLEGRTMEGIVFEGLRTTVVSDDEKAPRTIVDDRWTSLPLGLFGSIEAKSDNEKYSARISKLDMAEPDPKLFVIPEDYEIRELK